MIRTIQRVTSTIKPASSANQTSNETSKDTNDSQNNKTKKIENKSQNGSSSSSSSSKSSLIPVKKPLLAHSNKSNEISILLVITDDDVESLDEQKQINSAIPGLKKLDAQTNLKSSNQKYIGSSSSLLLISSSSSTSANSQWPSTADLFKRKKQTSSSHASSTRTPLKTKDSKRTSLSKRNDSLSTTTSSTSASSTSSSSRDAQQQQSPSNNKQNADNKRRVYDRCAYFNSLCSAKVLLFNQQNNKNNNSDLLKATTSTTTSQNSQSSKTIPMRTQSSSQQTSTSNLSSGILNAQQTLVMSKRDKNQTKCEDIKQDLTRSHDAKACEKFNTLEQEKPNPAHSSTQHRQFEASNLDAENNVILNKAVIMPNQTSNTFYLFECIPFLMSFSRPSLPPYFKAKLFNSIQKQQEQQQSESMSTSRDLPSNPQCDSKKDDVQKSLIVNNVIYGHHVPFSQQTSSSTKPIKPNLEQKLLNEKPQLPSNSLATSKIPVPNQIVSDVIKKNHVSNLLKQFDSQVANGPSKEKGIVQSSGKVGPKHVDDEVEEPTRIGTISKSKRALMGLNRKENHSNEEEENDEESYSELNSKLKNKSHELKRKYMQKQQENESIQKLTRQTRITFHDLHNNNSTQSSGLRKEASIEHHNQTNLAQVDLSDESSSAYEANLPSLPDLATEGIIKSQTSLSNKTKSRRTVGSVLKIANPLANLSVIDEEDSSQHQAPLSPRTSPVNSSSSTNNTEQASSQKPTQLGRSHDRRSGNDKFKRENPTKTSALQLQKKFKTNERDLPSSESDTSSHSNESLSSSTSSLASSSSFFLSENASSLKSNSNGNSNCKTNGSFKYRNSNTLFKTSSANRREFGLNANSLSKRSFNVSIDFKNGANVALENGVDSDQSDDSIDSIVYL